MNIRRPLALVLFIVFGLGCAATSAVDHALVPSLRASYPHIRVLIDRGAPGNVSIASQADEVSKALDSGSVAGIVWTPLEAPAMAGIKARVMAGEISMGVGDLRREEVTVFGDGMRKAGAQ